MKTMKVTTPEEHEAALQQVELLWTADLSPPQEKWLDALVTAIETYEETYFPINPIDLGTDE